MRVGYEVIARASAPQWPRQRASMKTSSMAFVLSRRQRVGPSGRHNRGFRWIGLLVSDDGSNSAVES